MNGSQVEFPLSFEPTSFHTSTGLQWDNPQLKPNLDYDLKELADQFIGLESEKDVALFLEVPVGQLLYILYRQKNKYRSFKIKKKSGKEREIESPNSSIKILQEKIKPILEYIYRPKAPVHGFVPGGKGIKSNAEEHQKKKYVLNVDLKDFFHSIANSTRKCNTRPKPQLLNRHRPSAAA